jgi:hypothetical protein
LVGFIALAGVASFAILAGKGDVVNFVGLAVVAGFASFAAARRAGFAAVAR